LRQLHLHACLTTARARREDVEDDLGAIHHAAAGRVLDVLPLRRRQFVVKKHEGDVFGSDALAKLVDFSLPQVRGRVGSVELLRQRADDLRAGRVGQALQFEQVLVEVMLCIRPLQRRTNQ
jgi:hypothetical protein